MKNETLKSATKVEEQFIRIEFYNGRYHLKGLVDREVIDHAKLEYGENWGIELCAKNEKIVSIDVLGKDYFELYKKICSLF